MGSLSIWHWLIVLSIVIMVFGTKKLRGAGSDLGEAMKNFKKSMKDGENTANEKPLLLMRDDVTDSRDSRG